MRFLFAYGSLRPTAAHAGIQHLVARLKPVGWGPLPGRPHYSGRYPGAIFDTPDADFTNGSVLGDVLELDSDQLLAEIDAYEGYDPYIRRPASTHGSNARSTFRASVDSTAGCTSCATCPRARFRSRAATI